MNVLMYTMKYPVQKDWRKYPVQSHFDSLLGNDDKSNVVLSLLVEDLFIF